MATLQSGKCFTVPTFFGMCCRSEWQERMYIYKWHEVDQTKHEIFCVHIVCNEIQVKVNLEITTFFFYLRFPYCPNFSDLGCTKYVLMRSAYIHDIKIFTNSFILFYLHWDDNVSFEMYSLFLLGKKKNDSIHRYTVQYTDFCPIRCSLQWDCPSLSTRKYRNINIVQNFVLCTFILNVQYTHTHTSIHICCTNNIITICIYKASKAPLSTSRSCSAFYVSVR